MLAISSNAKLVIVLGLVVVAATVSWDYRGRIAKERLAEEVTKAVTDKVDEIKKQMDEERAARLKVAQAQQRVLTELNARLEKIRVYEGELRTLLSKDREENRQFYAQPLPEKGREAWIRARSVAQEEPQPPSSPASR